MPSLVNGSLTEQRLLDRPDHQMREPTLNQLRAPRAPVVLGGSATRRTDHPLTIGLALLLFSRRAQRWRRRSGNASTRHGLSLRGVSGGSVGVEASAGLTTQFAVSND